MSLKLLISCVSPWSPCSFITFQYDLLTLLPLAHQQLLQSLMCIAFDLECIFLYMGQAEKHTVDREVIQKIEIFLRIKRLRQ